MLDAFSFFREIRDELHLGGKSFFLLYDTSFMFNQSVFPLSHCFFSSLSPPTHPQLLPHTPCRRERSRFFLPEISACLFLFSPLTLLRCIYFCARFPKGCVPIASKAHLCTVCFRNVHRIVKSAQVVESLPCHHVACRTNLPTSKCICFLVQSRRHGSGKSVFKRT